MEIADIFVINKADQPGRRPRGTWNCTPRASTAPIVRTVATEGKGIAGTGRRHGIAAAQIRAATVTASGLRYRAPRIDHLGIAVDNRWTTRIALLRDRSGSRVVASRDRCAARRCTSPCCRPATRASNCCEPSAPDSPIAKFLEKRGPGLHHVALRVPDLHAAVAAAAASGRAAVERAARGRGRPPLRFRASRLHRRRTAGTDSGEQTLKAEIGIIGGSGLYSMPGFEAQEEAQHRHAVRQPFGQLRARHAGRAARWRFWRGTAAAIASRPRS